MEVVLHANARKSLLSIPKKDRLRIVDALEEIQSLAHLLQHRDAIKLAGRKTDDYRLRVGNWRVKFTHINTVIFVTGIDNRQAGY